MIRLFRLLAGAREMLVLLREVEWMGGNRDDRALACPSCRAMQFDGHDEDCRLAAVLARFAP